MTCKDCGHAVKHEQDVRDAASIGYGHSEAHGYPEREITFCTRERPQSSLSFDGSAHGWAISSTAIVSVHSPFPSYRRHDRDEIVCISEIVE
jgi:hypothetical protein